MKKLLWVSAICGLSVITGCNRGDTGYTNGEETRLFEESVKLLKLYTDSLSQAKDTALIDGLMIRFREKLDRINNSVPPETDMHLSEGQNDTLASMTRSLLDARLKSMRIASGKELTDSVTSDSINASRSSYNQNQE